MITRLFILIAMLYPGIIPAQEIDQLIREKDYEYAKSLIDDRLEESETAELHFQKAQVLKAQILYTEALIAIDNALKLDSANIQYLREKADICSSLGDYDATINCYQRAIQAKPDDLLLKYELGLTQLKLSDFKNALSTFEQINVADSTNLMFRKHYSLSAYKAGNFPLAIRLYEKSIQQNKKDVMAYLNLASSYAAIKQPNKNLEVMQQAAQLFPNNKTVQHKLGSIYFGMKKYEDAEICFDNYLQKFDSIVPVLQSYGYCLYSNKKTDKALVILTKCDNLLPEDPVTNYYLGLCNKKLKNFEAASQNFSFAIEASIPPFLPDMYHHQGQIYGQLREYQKSIDMLQLSYNLDNSNTGALLEIATTYEEFSKNKALALKYYRQFLKEASTKDPNRPYAQSRVESIKNAPQQKPGK